MFNTSKESVCPVSRKLNRLPLSCFSFILPLHSLFPPSHCGRAVTWALDARGEENKGNLQLSKAPQSTQRIDVFKESARLSSSQMKVWSHSSVKTCGRRKRRCLQMFWAFWWTAVTWPPQLSVLMLLHSDVSSDSNLYSIYRPKVSKQDVEFKIYIYTQWSSTLIYLMSYY